MVHDYLTAVQFNDTNDSLIAPKNNEDQCVTSHDRIYFKEMDFPWRYLNTLTSSFHVGTFVNRKARDVANSMYILRDVTEMKKLANFRYFVPYLATCVKIAYIGRFQEIHKMSKESSVELKTLGKKIPIRIRKISLSYETLV